MKIIVIGQSGSGKSTLARKIKEITDFPLLPLDLLWHTTDYSIQAKKVVFARTAIVYGI